MNVKLSRQQQTFFDGAAGGRLLIEGSDLHCEVGAIVTFYRVLTRGGGAVEE